MRCNTEPAVSVLAIDSCSGTLPGVRVIFALVQTNR